MFFSSCLRILTWFSIYFSRLAHIFLDFFHSSHCKYNVHRNEPNKIRVCWKLSIKEKNPWNYNYICIFFLEVESGWNWMLLQDDYFSIVRNTLLVKFLLSLLKFMQNTLVCIKKKSFFFLNYRLRLVRFESNLSQKFDMTI